MAALHGTRLTLTLGLCALGIMMHLGNVPRRPASEVSSESHSAQGIHGQLCQRNQTTCSTVQSALSLASGVHTLRNQTHKLCQWRSVPGAGGRAWCRPNSNATNDLCSAPVRQTNAVSCKRCRSQEHLSAPSAFSSSAAFACQLLSCAPSPPRADECHVAATRTRAKTKPTITHTYTLADP